MTTVTAPLARSVRLVGRRVRAGTELTVKLTPFRFAEVEGLLDIRRDTIESGEDLVLWGEVDRATMTLNVLDAAEAVDELRWRADWFEEEAPGHTGYDISGQAEARSLRGLADRIESATVTQPA